MDHEEIEEVICAYCSGTGLEISGNICPFCNGNGYVKIEIKDDCGDE